VKMTIKSSYGEADDDTKEQIEALLDFLASRNLDLGSMISIMALAIQEIMCAKHMGDEWFVDTFKLTYALRKVEGTN